MSPFGGSRSKAPQFEPRNGFASLVGDSCLAGGWQNSIHSSFCGHLCVPRYDKPTPTSKTASIRSSTHPRMVHSIVIRRPYPCQPSAIVHRLYGCCHPSHRSTPGRVSGLPPQTLLQPFHLAVAEAGLPKMRFHDLRHSAASLMSAVGVPIKTQMAVLGHTTMGMTLRYTHVDASDQASATATLGRIMGGTTDE